VGARGPVIESLTWVELPAVYYALRRHADYSPTGGARVAAAAPSTAAADGVADRDGGRYNACC